MADPAEQTSVSRSFVEHNNTLHGFDRVAYSEKWYQIAVWGFVITICLAMMAYECQEITKQYLAEPVAVSIGELQVSTMPPILVCPSVWVDKAKLARIWPDPKQLYRFWISHYFDIDHEEATLIHPTFHHLKEMIPDQDFLDTLTRDRLDHNAISQAVNAEYSLAKDFILDMMKDPEEIFVTQTGFEVAQESIQKVATTHGGCYQVLPSQKEYPEFLAEFANTEIVLYNLEAPFDSAKRSTERLFFGERARIMTPEGRLDIGSGMDVVVHLTVSHVSRVSTKWKPCRRWPLADSLTCLMKCMNEVVCKVCRLMDTESPLNMTDICTLHSAYLEYTHCTLDYYGEEGQRNMHFCHRSCPFPCEERIFASSVVQTVGVSPESSHGNMTGIRVRFHSPLTAQYLEESRVYSWDTLVCNLGGTISLFCGASIISIVHLVVFALNLAKTGIRCGKKKK